MDNEHPLKAEFALAKEVLGRQSQEKKEKVVACHIFAARKIRSALWETEVRLKKLKASGTVVANRGNAQLPSRHHAELLLDRRLAAKEKLLGIS